MCKEDKDIFFMRKALEQARMAGKKNEVPVGVVCVFAEKIIAKAFNQCEMLTDPTAHAELIAITSACAAMDAQRLIDMQVYVTKEPCVMCAGALVHARISRLIIGASDIKAGACGTVLNLVNHPSLNHSIETVFGVEEEACRTLLQEFFQAKR